MQVSIVVPLFNKARYVARCLTSILNQNFTDFELIVVNDGSTDEGEEVVRSFSDERVRLINQANAGPGAARNRGMGDARGEFIAFLDADDEWLPGYLEQSLRILMNHPETAATTCCYVESPSTTDMREFWSKRGIVPGLHRTTPETRADILVQIVAYMLPCSTVSRIGALRKLGGFYQGDHCRYAEDAFLWIQILLNYPVFFTLEPLVRIHRDAAELSKNLAGCRPVEPFLQRPDLLQRSCPENLRPLLDRFLAIRAFKTACVLGYWGHWREARAVRAQFKAHAGWAAPYFLPSLVCSTPVGSLLGATWRRSIRRS